MDNKHAGHRQRLKNKIKKNGLRSLEEHEILEVLLTYCIPRKNTNNIAHELLNKFKSISNVIDAESNQLKLIEGLGEESGLFLQIIKDFVEIYLENKKTSATTILTNPKQCIDYFRTHFIIKNTETFVGFCLTDKGRLINHFLIDGKSETEINFPIKILTENITPNNVKQLVLIHTHPNGSVNPSQQDIDVTNRISNICAILGCKLADHCIVNETDYCSFKDLNLICYQDINKIKINNSSDYIIKNKRKDK